MRTGNFLLHTFQVVDRERLHIALEQLSPKQRRGARADTVIQVNAVQASVELEFVGAFHNERRVNGDVQVIAGQIL